MHHSIKPASRQSEQSRPPSRTGPAWPHHLVWTMGHHERTGQPGLRGLFPASPACPGGRWENRPGDRRGPPCEVCV